MWAPGNPAIESFQIELLLTLHHRFALPATNGRIDT